MKKKFKVVVAHPAQQHSYRTAVALKEYGYLYKYITTVYNKKKSFTSFIIKFLKGDNFKRASSRSCNELNDNDVLQIGEIGSLFLLYLQRIDKRKYIYNIWRKVNIDLFNRKLVKYIVANNVDAVVLYDTMSNSCLKLLNKKAPNVIKILDMSAPSFSYMNMIFKEDLKKNNKYSTSLNQEVNSSLYKNTLAKSIEEINLADYFLVASSFSEESLYSHKIHPEKILKIPYGIDNNYTKELKSKKYKNRKLNCIFVGRVTQKKGAFYLLKAINNTNLDKFSFSFIGTYNKNEKYYEDYKNKCSFEGHVTKDKMDMIYNSADILVFPSLADGFGLSVLEALSYGIPVICSSNSGARDLIIDGYNGFVISPGDEIGINKKLQWYDDNRDEIPRMSMNARRTAFEYTWDKYNKEINNGIESIRKYKDEI